ncbi:MAG: hypothetical protein LUF25_01565, partial [Phascolarctobacterium sp.]|nr:hypothetical protein [Phascolarctobacterium sp.]
STTDSIAMDFLTVQLHFTFGQDIFYIGVRKLQHIITLAEKVLAGNEISQAEAVFLINAEDDDTMLLLAMADKIRQKFVGNTVDCCAVVNGCSGKCSENCKFCAQSSYYDTGVKEYGLLSDDEIFLAAKKAKHAEAVRFSIVTSGNGQSKADDFKNICRILKRLRLNSRLKYVLLLVF